MYNCFTFQTGVTRQSLSSVFPTPFSTLTLSSSCLPSLVPLPDKVREMYITYQLCASHCSDTDVREEWMILCVYMFCIYGPVCLLTGHGKAAQRAGLSLGLTHPLLTALSGHLDPAWHGAVRSGQHHVQVAAWHTGDLPIAAHALVLTAREKGLAILIDRTVQNTHISLMSWRKKTK